MATMDIRKVLQKYTASEVREIVRKHNEHYKIRLTGKTKADLIDSLSKLYKSVKGDYLIPAEHPLVMRKIKVQITKKGKAPKKIEVAPEPMPAPKTKLPDVINEEIQRRQTKAAKKADDEVKEFLQRYLRSILNDINALADKDYKHNQYGNNFFDSVRNINAFIKRYEEEGQPEIMKPLIDKYNELMKTNKLFARRMKHYAKE